MKLQSIILFLSEGIDVPKAEDFINKVIPNFWAFIVQLFAFIIMILIVIKFAYKPVSNFLAKRKEYVNNNLKEAEEKNLEASRNLEETRNNLQGSQKEAIQIIQDARKQAEKERVEILEETNKDVANKRAKALEDIEVAKNKALKDMHDEVVDIAIEATKNILNREVDVNDDKAMLDNFVSDLIDKKIEK